MKNEVWLKLANRRIRQTRQKIDFSAVDHARGFECCTYGRDGQFNGAHVAGHPGPLRLVAEPIYWPGVGQECGRIGQNSRDGL
jgi:hypothetical protein